MIEHWFFYSCSIAFVICILVYLSAKIDLITLFIPEWLITIILFLVGVNSVYQINVISINSATEPNPQFLALTLLYMIASAIFLIILDRVLLPFDFCIKI